MTGEFSDGVILRVFVGEADQVEGAPVYEQIVSLARNQGLGGATVIRGIESFGQKGTTHTARLLRLAEDLPVVVEIVESGERIENFLPFIDALFEKAGCGGLVATERVRIKKYPAR